MTIKFMTYFVNIRNMATEDNKSKIAKLLNGLEVPEVKVGERCRDIMKEIQEKFGQEVEMEGSEITQEESQDLSNPYKVDVELLRENERKLKELLKQSKKPKKEAFSELTKNTDPARPWRTHSCKEKLLRVENDLKRHHEKGFDAISPMEDEEMNSLVKHCHEEAQDATPIPLARLRETVDNAKKKLPNFQYRSIENSTATVIMPKAHHIIDNTNEGVTPPPLTNAEM